MNAEAKEVATTEGGAIVAQDESQAMLEMIERVALNPDADVEKMRALLDMRKELMAEQARVRFHEAMARVQAAGVQIRNDKKNTHTRSRYASMLAISKALDPYITKEGFSKSYGTGKADIEGWVRITCDVSLGGHEKHYYVDLPLDTVGPEGKRNKTDIHGAKSAITYGRVILKLMIFDVVTGDEIDDDGNLAGGKVPDTITEEDAIKLREWIESLERDETKFCKALGIQSLESMPANMLGKARNLLKKAEAKK